MAEAPVKRQWWALIVLGLLAGFLSGLLGVGGGIVIAPTLLALGFGQRLAAGTSLAAIVPTSIVGVIDYALHGQVSWLAAGLIAAGAIVGAQIGTALLPRVSRRALQWGFVGFLALVFVSLLVVIPSRGAEMSIDMLTGIAIVIFGLGVGILSGLLGVGGGFIIVPLLVLLFGASDVVAKGTSLLVMVPTAISGTIGNVRRRNVDLPSALAIGLAACTTTSLGALLARGLDPMTANIIFAALLLFLGVQMAVRAAKPDPA